MHTRIMHTIMHTRIDAVDRESETGWFRCCAGPCHTEKPHADFHKHRRDHKGIQRVCKACTASRDKLRGKHPLKSAEYHKGRYAKDRDQVIAYSRAHYRTTRGRLLTLISAARGRANKRELLHDLDIDWALARWDEQGGRCLITGVPLQVDTPLRTLERYLNPFAPSLDRKNPDLGYTKDNTRIVCVAANLAMNRFGEEVFATMLQGYAATHSEG